MNSILRIVFLGYFISHIPITLCIDLQGLFGSHYPKPLQDLFAWYIASFNDVVMLEMKPWIKSFIYCEMLFQLPFFFYVTHGLINKSNAIRIPSIVYGAHVTTTLFPIMLEVMMSAQMQELEKITLLSVYSPYLLLPLTLMLYMCFNAKPFGDEDKKRK